MTLTPTPNAIAQEVGTEKRWLRYRRFSAPFRSPPIPSRRGAPPPAGRSRRRRGSRTPIMTAHRQRALACAAALAQGPRRPRDLKASIPDAYDILHRNVYGWFVAVERGVYDLTETGQRALLRWPQMTSPPDLQYPVIDESMPTIASRSTRSGSTLPQRSAEAK